MADARRDVHGMVLGKFYPPHAGHSLVIGRAQAACERVTVVLLAHSGESIPVALRHAWLEEMHPGVRVVSGVADHPIDYGDPRVWDLWEGEVRALCPEPVDAVFSSESYGDELARRLGARHQLVDMGRGRVPVSGTQVRADPAANWRYLAPPVRAWFVHRFAVVGAESSGTTTVARSLAAHFDTLWVPEYGRDYTYKKVGREGQAPPWNSDEFVQIAHRQLELEDEAARGCPVPLLFCDTDALATAVWYERYMGGWSEQVAAIAEPSRYATYFLTRPDIPFEQDGIRDGEHLREWMTGRFREVLLEHAGGFVELAGGREQRMRDAVAVVEARIERGWQLAAPHAGASSP